VKRLFGFKFRVDFIWVGLISIWAGFCFNQVGLIINGNDMSYPNYK
jgi:hypothetical protein